MIEIIATVATIVAVGGGYLAFIDWVCKTTKAPYGDTE
jgi:hypothetical protein